MKRFGEFVDEIFIFAGCLLIVSATYRLSPIAAQFVAGGMLVAAGVLYGLGAGRKK